MQFVLDTSAVGTFCEHDSHPTYRRKRADYTLHYQTGGEVLTRATCAAHLTNTIDTIASARIEAAIAANKAARASASPPSETIL